MKSAQRLHAEHLGTMATIADIIVAPTVAVIILWLLPLVPLVMILHAFGHYRDQANYAWNTLSPKDKENG